jgi:ubiquinone/menaquinone biosynthesis C-methylase UbiE
VARSIGTDPNRRLSQLIRSVFPRLMDAALATPEIARLRRELLAAVRGDILEIGFGTGLNLACYPAHVRRLTTVDVRRHPLAELRLAASPITVEQHAGSAEDLPFATASFDSVVSTWTLCSIPDVVRALGEVRRVLRPPGRFFFLEHGLSPERAVQFWQHVLTPFYRLAAGGCHLNRDVATLIEGSGFRILNLIRFYLPEEGKHTGYTFRGIAAPATSGGAS